MYNKKLMMQLFVLLIIGLLTVGCGGTQEESSAPLPISPTATHIAPTATPSEGEGVLQLARKITWLRSNNLYGHAGIMIQADDQVIYLDPVDLANKEGLPKADIILVTHDHGDHFSSETIASLSTESTKIVSIESITSSIDGQNALALSPGQKTTVDGFEIEGIPAYNNNHPKASGYLGLVLSVNGIRVYCSGDTGLISEMESLSNIDIAVLNVRKPYALSGEQVVKFAEIVKPKIIIPIHWMPDDNTYKDIEEIEYIQQNIPDTSLLSVLELN